METPQGAVSTGPCHGCPVTVPSLFILSLSATTVTSAAAATKPEKPAGQDWLRSHQA